MLRSAAQSIWRSALVMSVWHEKVLHGFNFRKLDFCLHQKWACGLICHSLLTHNVCGAMVSVRRDLGFGGIYTQNIWGASAIQSGRNPCTIIKTIQGLNVWYGIVLTLKHHPRGEIWLALLLRTGTSLSQCTSTIARLHGHAPSYNSNTRHNPFSGAEMHLIIYSSFRDCPWVLSVK